MLTKVCIVKTLVFPLVMCGCESWTIKAEHWRTDAFKLWSWRRFLRIPQTTRRSNQSILKEISPDDKAEAPVLWPPDMKNWLFGKDPDAGKDWGQEEKQGDRGWDGWMASPTQWTLIWANFSRQLKDREAWCAVVYEVTKRWTQLGAWKKTTNPTQHQKLWRQGSAICILTSFPCVSEAC